MKTLKDAERVTPEQLKGMTPPQIDELFAAAWDRRHDLTMSMFPIWDELHREVGDHRIGRRDWGMSTGAVAQKAADSTGEARRILDRLNGIKEKIAELDRTTLAKLEAEFDRRGKWSRVYLVTDGHAHSSRYCSSCNKGELPTRFAWMIDYSDKSQAEIIEAIGERACTVCYPDAPVNRGRKVITASVLLTPEEVERQQQRDQEKVRRAEKAAKAALNAITQPDGTPLRDEMSRDGKQKGSIVKTLRTARTELKQECWYQYAWSDGDGGHERNIQHLARAVAWKENGHPVGTEPTPEEIETVIKPLRDKAVKEVDKARAAGR